MLKSAMSIVVFFSFFGFHPISLRQKYTFSRNIQTEINKVEFNFIE